MAGIDFTDRGLAIDGLTGDVARRAAADRRDDRHATATSSSASAGTIDVAALKATVRRTRPTGAARPRRSAIDRAAQWLSGGTRYDVALRIRNKRVADLLDESRGRATGAPDDERRARPAGAVRPGRARRSTCPHRSRSRPPRAGRCDSRSRAPGDATARHRSREHPPVARRRWSTRTSSAQRDAQGALAATHAQLCGRRRQGVGQRTFGRRDRRRRASMSTRGATSPARSPRPRDRRPRPRPAGRRASTALLPASRDAQDAAAARRRARLHAGVDRRATARVRLAGRRRRGPGRRSAVVHRRQRHRRRPATASRRSRRRDWSRG